MNFREVTLPCGIFDIPVRMNVPTHLFSTHSYWGFSDGVWMVAFIKNSEEMMICSWPVETNIINNSIHILGMTGEAKSIYISNQGPLYVNMSALLADRIARELV